MGMNVWRGSGLCLLLRIARRTLAWSASDVRISQRILRGQAGSMAAPELCHTACPLTSLLFAHSGPYFFIIVACDGFGAAVLVHWAGCWACGSGGDV